MRRPAFTAAAGSPHGPVGIPSGDGSVPLQATALARSENFTGRGGSAPIRASAERTPRGSRRGSAAGELRPGDRGPTRQRRRPGPPPLHAGAPRALMSELRFDELRNEEVVYAIHR